MYKTKLSILKDHMAADEWRDALRVAAKFPQLGAHKAQITRGWEALSNPRMYRQMGQDPAQLFRAAIAALKTRYL